ncbi:transglycosylase SLT domain-containing protein [Micavibrio aeruginosavorus]|uniref:transglycosylase SLT domain-containing protein n=1 Tax=Micavibrio aeruginosavorus TaxID=349221 RepID=UPI003F4AB1AC
MRFILCVLVSLFTIAITHTARAQDDAVGRQLSMELEQRTGDLDDMTKATIIRVLVPYSRTLYTVDMGKEDGMSVRAVQEFSKYVSQKLNKKGQPPVTVALIATPRERLLDDLNAGKGDIALGNITITPERQKDVNFTHPVSKPFNMIIVAHKDAPPLTTLNDLAGKTVYVREITSYHAMLEELNKQLRKNGLKKVKIEELPDNLEDEDKLDMVNAGILEYSVVDSWLFDMWREQLPDVVAYEDPAMILSANNNVGWAYRKKNPKLGEFLNGFVDDVLIKQGITNIIAKQIANRIQTLDNPNKEAARKRFQDTVETFRKYGENYNFDYLMLMAQGYQESRLDQKTVSHVGAIGIMQVMPATGKQMEVGDIKMVENNIHAGTKYLDHVMEVYLDDSQLDEQNRALFAFAAYNAGPNRIQKLREEAKKAGLNPNKWLGNVEHIAAKRVGMEPVNYVRNIYKYYVSYKLIQAQEEERRKAIADVKE